MPSLNALLFIGGSLLLGATVLVPPGSKPAPPRVVHRFTALANAGATVVVAFTLRDCGGRIERLRAWERAAIPPHVRLTGVVMAAGGNDSLIRFKLNGARIPFPIQVDKANQLHELLLRSGYARTPAIAVFDGVGRLRLTLPYPDSTLALSDSQMVAVMQYAATLE